MKEIKSLLKAVLPNLLAKNGFKHHGIPGKVYLIAVESAVGLVWKELGKAELLMFAAPTISHVDSLEQDLFQKVS